MKSRSIFTRLSLSFRNTSPSVSINSGLSKGLCPATFFCATFHAKDKQQQLKTEVASAAQAYKHYKNTLGETDSATIAAKANLDAYKSEYRAAVQEVKKLEGQNVALKKSTQNAADACIILYVILS